MKKYKPKDYIIVYEIPKQEINKIDFALCKQPRQTLKQYYNDCEIKPDLICNGGFFNMANGETIFNFKDNNKIISNNISYRWGMGLVNGELKFGGLDYENYEEFISAYPVLIEKGKAITINFAQEIDYKARRTILGYNDKNIYIVAIELPGMRFAEIQKLLLDLGCTYAINLDGGGSTKILEKGESVTSVLYNRAVDNILAIYLKPLYRVQAGAFKFETGAKKLLKQIQELPDTIGAGYKNAYIRKINGLYKVQIGAFSKKLGAEKVKADLASKGISSFITT